MPRRKRPLILFPRWVIAYPGAQRTALAHAAVANLGHSGSGKLGKEGCPASCAMAEKRTTARVPLDMSASVAWTGRPECINRIIDGCTSWQSVKTLFLAGEKPACLLPGSCCGYQVRTRCKVEFLVVSDLFMTETAASWPTWCYRPAHIAEKEGTFTAALIAGCNILHRLIPARSRQSRSQNFEIYFPR